MARYVIKRDQARLPERLTRYKSELNEEQFRVVTAQAEGRARRRRCRHGQDAGDHLSRRVSDRARRLAAADLARDIYQPCRARDAAACRGTDRLAECSSRVGRDVSSDRESDAAAARGVDRLRSELLDPRQRRRARLYQRLHRRRGDRHKEETLSKGRGRSDHHLVREQHRHADRECHRRKISIFRDAHRRRSSASTRIYQTRKQRAERDGLRRPAAEL